MIDSIRPRCTRCPTRRHLADLKSPTRMDGENRIEPQGARNRWRQRKPWASTGHREPREINGSDPDAAACADSDNWRGRRIPWITGRPPRALLVVEVAPTAV
ncbi:hypothetical protein MTO96_001365 [Rhipicephalus appendiculatus]